MKTILETKIIGNSGDSLKDYYSITERSLKDALDLIIDTVNDDNVEGVLDLVGSLSKDQKRTVVLSLLLNISETVSLVFIRLLIGEKAKDEDLTVFNITETILDSKYCDYHINALLVLFFNGLAVSGFIDEIVSVVANKETYTDA